MVSQSVSARKTSDMLMRTALNGNDPMRLEPTSAYSAVTVQAAATMSESVSPTNM